jgi:hypothetical protein
VVVVVELVVVLEVVVELVVVLEVVVELVVVGPGVVVVVDGVGGLGPGPIHITTPSKILPLLA